MGYQTRISLSGEQRPRLEESSQLLVQVCADWRIMVKLIAAMLGIFTTGLLSGAAALSYANAHHPRLRVNPAITARIVPLPRVMSEPDQSGTVSGTLAVHGEKIDENRREMDRQATDLLTIHHSLDEMERQSTARSNSVLNRLDVDEAKFSMMLAAAGVALGLINFVSPVLAVLEFRRKRLSASKGEN